jgi:2',3'-cyclic-nucleotide 2'-phosphodiesterase (5'-nucleotidase family)
VATHARKVGELTIGFFGLVTPDTDHLSNTGPEVKFAPVLDTARAAVKQLKDQGADAVVALTHLTIADDRVLAREVKGIDVILGGHDHDPITFYEGRRVHLQGRERRSLPRRRPHRDREDPDPTRPAGEGVAA